MLRRERNVLPGFGLTLGFTTFFLTAIVLLPLAAQPGWPVLIVYRPPELGVRSTPEIAA